QIERHSMKLNSSRLRTPQPCRRHTHGSCRSIQETPAEISLRTKSAVTNFRIIAFLTEDGRSFEQAEIEERFSKTATEIGAEALIMLPPARKIAAPEDWNSHDTFRYCAAVLLCA